MTKIITFITMALMTVASFASPYSDPRCPYEAYTPNDIYQGTFYAFADRGITILPQDLLVKDLTGRAILRGAGVVGNVEFTKNSRQGFSQLTFWDTRGRILAVAKETVGPCPKTYPVGRCEITTWQTELGKTGETPEFSIAWTRNGMDLRHYGQHIHPIQWQRAFRDSLAWVVDTYEEEVPSRILVGNTLLERFQIAQATDPFLIPYLPLFHAVTEDGQVQVVGRVPSNYVYHRIIDNALNAGIFIQPDIVIDSRILTPPILPSEHYGCGFEN